MKNSSNKIGRFWGLIIVAALLTISGCARIGKDFNAAHVQQIKIGETTQSDIVKMFGQPWRKGVENGIVMWTYGRYTYRVIGETETKDLVVRFKSDGKVRSYTFNETADKK